MSKRIHRRFLQLALEAFPVMPTSLQRFTYDLNPELGFEASSTKSPSSSLWGITTAAALARGHLHTSCFQDAARTRLREARPPGSLMLGCLTLGIARAIQGEWGPWRDTCTGLSSTASGWMDHYHTHQPGEHQWDWMLELHTLGQ